MTIDARDFSFSEHGPGNADAIEKAIAQAAPGDVISLPTGVFPLGRPVVIDRAVTLDGADGGGVDAYRPPATTLRWAGGAQEAPTWMVRVQSPQYHLDRAFGLRLRDIGLDGANAERVAALHLYHPFGCNFERLAAWNLNGGPEWIDGILVTTGQAGFAYGAAHNTFTDVSVQSGPRVCGLRLTGGAFGLDTCANSFWGGYLNYDASQDGGFGICCEYADANTFIGAKSFGIGGERGCSALFRTSAIDPRYPAGNQFYGCSLTHGVRREGPPIQNSQRNMLWGMNECNYNAALGADLDGVMVLSNYGDLSGLLALNLENAGADPVWMRGRACGIEMWRAQRVGNDLQIAALDGWAAMELRAERLRLSRGGATGRPEILISDGRPAMAAEPGSICLDSTGRLWVRQQKDWRSI